MKKDACARAEAAPSKEDARARAPRAFDSIAAAGVRGGAVKVEDVKHVLKKIMSLCIMKKLSLCALPCTPVSWRGLCASASMIRVWEKWRCKKKPAHPS